MEDKVKYISKSISLPLEKWDELEVKAQEQGITKNKLVANLVEKYLKKNRRERGDKGSGEEKKSNKGNYNRI